MLSIIKTVSLQGLEGYIVNVEVDVTNGLPCLEIVGLPGTTIKESKERIRSAIRNAGFEMMNKRITVNSSPGEISLAHNGVLFLDEFTEFKRQCLEVLREPLEDKEVVISRVNYNLRYPCNFMLIASMNPCPCGYLGSAKRKCTCKQYEINRYIKKISGPLIDRIDLKVNVFDIEYSDINNNDEESSEEIKKRVNIARNIQINRYKNESICSNSQLTGKMINEYCKIDDKGQKIMGQLFNKYNLTMRSYTRILKVARTIADLKQREDIKYDDIIEAAQYKCQEWR